MGTEAADCLYGRLVLQQPQIHFYWAISCKRQPQRVSLTFINVAGTPVNKEESLTPKEIAGLITSRHTPPGPWHRHQQLEDRQFLLADSGVKALAKRSSTSGSRIITLSPLTKFPLSTCWITELLVVLLASRDCVNAPLFGQAHAIRPLGVCH